MSLRTRLLAAIVGLNGVILLLALYLLVRGEAAVAPPPPPGVVADLVDLGGALVGCRDPRERRAARATLDELSASGTLADVLVVEEVAEDGEGTACVWPAEDFATQGDTAEELPAGPRRDAAELAFRRACQHHRNRWIGDEALAVVLPGRLEHGGRRGLVASLASGASSRSGVRLVYLVLVAGVVLVTAVAFGLVSRFVVRPLGRIADAADRIARGDYKIEVERAGTNDEFDRTIAAFNRMAREIGEYQAHLEDRVLSALGRMRKAEQHLAIAQRLAATGKLASGVAHEINNPLGGMKNAARALGRGDLSPEKTREYLDLIGEGLGRVEETVKKFLSFTPRHVEPRPTDLTDVATKASALARHRIDRSAATLVLDLAAPGEAVVFGDPHELQQVALNLLLNAADAVAEKGGGGTVTIIVRRREEDVMLAVVDDGVGLSQEDQDRCFDLFFTTKEVGEGSGLGLAVAHTIVTNHGGRIEVESRPGEGATFRVLLPREEHAAEDE